MAETALPIITAKQPFDNVTADSLDFVLTAADAVNGNKFTCTGKELLVIQNSGASPYTVTINSVEDEKNRSENLAAYSLAAGEFAYWTGGLTNSKGWKQTDGTITMIASNAAVKFAVIRLPV